MFCTHLRKRPQWAAVPQNLLSSQAPRWQEKTIDTHDISIPSTRPHELGQFRHLILLSSSDMQSDGNGMVRVERLWHLNGGSNVGIFFLLKEQGSELDGMISYMKLQADLLFAGFEIPIIPLHSVRSFQATLMAYIRQIHGAQISPTTVNVIKDLLPYCSSAAPLREHARNVLSDLVGSLADLALAATTEDGQQTIRRYIEDTAEAEGVIGFWQEEYIAD